ncbi:MAG: MauE/DoxX family redox-associated membrane protein [Steroidobacteraceae bacterium]
MHLDPTIVLVITGGLCLLFFVAAYHKMADFDRHSSVVRAYRLVPEALVVPAALSVVAAECTALVLLLWPASRALGAVLAAALLGLYAVAMAINLARGRFRIDCGCLGPGKRQWLRWSLVWRNTGLMLASLALLLPTTSRPVGLMDLLVAMVAVVTLAILYAALVLLGSQGDRNVART